MMFQLVLIDHFEQGFPEFLYFTDQWIFFSFLIMRWRKEEANGIALPSFYFARKGH